MSKDKKRILITLFCPSCEEDLEGKVLVINTNERVFCLPCYLQTAGKLPKIR